VVVLVKRPRPCFPSPRTIRDAAQCSGVRVHSFPPSLGPEREREKTRLPLSLFFLFFFLRPGDREKGLNLGSSLPRASSYRFFPPLSGRKDVFFSFPLGRLAADSQGVDLPFFSSFFSAEWFFPGKNGAGRRLSSPSFLRKRRSLARAQNSSRCGFEVPPRLFLFFFGGMSARAGAFHGEIKEGGEHFLSSLSSQGVTGKEREGPPPFLPSFSQGRGDPLFFLLPGEKKECFFPLQKEEDFRPALGGG